jgi:hypothetical protein
VDALDDGGGVIGAGVVVAQRDLLLQLGLGAVHLLPHGAELGGRLDRLGSVGCRSARQTGGQQRDQAGGQERTGPRKKVAGHVDPRGRRLTFR